MRGKSLLLLGGILILCGAIALSIGYASAHGTMIAGAWVALLLGAGCAIFGASQLFASLNNPRELDREEENRAEVRALVQAVGAIAAADGQINPQEVKAITTVYQRITGVRISDSEIDEILFDVDNHFDVTETLKKLTPKLTAEIRRTIILSCYEVMISDQNIDRAETIKIAAIGKALGFKQVEIDNIITSAA